MPMVYCLVGWKSLAQAALFQLDFSGCWSRISSCTGRADFSAALCVTVLPGRCRGMDGAWYGPAPAPPFCQRGPLAQLASTPHSAPCVWAFLGNRCMFSVLNCTRNPEWVVRRHCGDGPAGYRGGVSALSGASCYSQHCHWPLPQFNRSSEAIQTSFPNLELWSRALGSGLRRRRRWQWRRQGGLPGRRTSRRPPPSPLRSPPSGRRRWRGEWPTSQQLWTWSSSRRT